MGELEKEGDALVAAWVALGRVDDALRWAEARAAPADRFAALVAVLRALGERKLALEERVQAIRPRIEAAKAELGAAPQPALTLAVAWMRAGRLEESARALEAMPLGGLRASGEGALAAALAEAGDVPRALAMARGLALEWFGPDRVPDTGARLPASRAEVLAEIAHSRFSVNDAVDGVAIGEEADAARSGIQDWKQSVAGLAIVRAFARGARWDHAQRVAGALPTSDGRQGAWLALIEAAAACGDIEQAERLVRAAEGSVDATDALVIGAPGGATGDVRHAIAGFMAAELRAALVAALCRARSHARARDVVQSIPRNTRAWICASAALGACLVTAGARDEAIVVFDEIVAALGAVSSPDWAELTANALAASGFGARARALLQNHPAPSRERAIADAALAAFEAGHRGAMRDLITALSPEMPFARAEALRRLGSALAAAGDFDSAESLADEISAEISPPIAREQRHLFALIALAAARRGDAIRALKILRHLAARSLYAG